jgi:hypothetical protein
MKKFTIILSALLVTAISSPVVAKKQQKTELKKQKAEIKMWKQRKAAMRPLQLKALVEENHKLKANSQRLATEIQASNEELLKLIKLKVPLEAQRNEQSNQGTESPGDDYEGEGTSRQSGKDYYLAQGIIGLEGFSNNDWAIDKDGQCYIKGIVFKVQIGAYKERDLSDVLEGAKPKEVFEQEQSEGVNMYTLRHFRDYWKANQFKKELRAMGLKDAWVVAFKDGKRIPLKDVLQGVIQKQ